MTTRRLRYTEHRASAKRRGIPFRLTFDEWWSIWLASGYWEERGKRRGQFVMARPGDVGAYEVGNVFITTTEDNTREEMLGKKRTAETKQRMSLASKGNTHWLGKRHTTETKLKMAAIRKAAWARGLYA